MAEVDEIITNEPSEVEKRIRSLSGKVKEEAEAKEAALKAKADAEAAAAESKRNAEFAEGFSDVVSTNPAAKEHKDEIKAKVMAGYSVEDATYAVLGKAGKLGVQESGSPAGGSAATTVTSSPEKTLETMTQAERRAALEERQGEIADILAPKFGR